MNIRTMESVELTLPMAPKMVNLVPDDTQAHGGAAIADTNVAEGFLVIMRAYLLQAENDLIKLYINGDMVSNTTIAKGAENDDTPLRAPDGAFQKGYNRIQFGIKRLSQEEEFTPKLILLHRTSPPGDKPPVLNINVSHDSIGPDEADNVNVTINYKNAQWHDRIIVDCNGVRVQYTLQPSSTFPISPIPESFVIPIPRDVLEQGGDDSDFEFKFRVFDYLSNPSGPQTWSNAVTTDVHLSRRTLPMAVLREIPTDNNDDPAIVDRDKLKGGPLWAVVHLPEKVAIVGDSIELAFIAEQGGTVVGRYEEKVRVKHEPTLLAWKIPNDKVIPDSTVTVRYQLFRGTAEIGSSTPTHAKVIGLGQLPAPVLLNPAINPIDPIAYPDGVIIRIDYQDAEAGEKARLKVVEDHEETPEFPWLAFNNNKYVDIILTQDFLAKRSDQNIKLHWSLDRGDGESGQSDILELSVVKAKIHVEDWEAETPFYFKTYIPQEFKSGITVTVDQDSPLHTTRLQAPESWLAGKMTMFVTSLAIVRFQLATPARLLEFTATDVNLPHHKVYFYDKNNAFIEKMRLPVTGSKNTATVMFSSQKGRFAYSFIIIGKGEAGSDSGYTIDNIKWSL